MRDLFKTQRPSQWNDLARECAELQSKLFAAGLYRTAKRMTVVVHDVGYEIADLRNAELTKKSEPHEQL